MRLQSVIFTLARTIDWSLAAAGCPHPDSQLDFIRFRVQSG